MEQKRTLWIVAAAGVFLLVVVGAALIIFRPVSSGYPVETGFVTSAIQPSADTPAPTRSPFENSGAGAYDLQQTPFLSGTSAPATDPAASPSMEQSSVSSSPNEIHSDNLTVYANNTTVYEQGQITYNFDLNKMMAKNQDAVTTSIDYSAPAETKSPVTAKEEAKSKPVTDDSYYTPAPKKTETVKQPAKTESRTAASKPAAKTETSKTVSKTASKPAAKTASKPAAPKTPDRFWIQAASYTNKEGADNARKILEANKMNNEVFTYTDSKGKLFYRVRIGPYTTSSEAEYWQKRLAVIEQFSNTPSYIVNSSAKK